ncbi:MAG: alpha,alpha-trehalase TreA [Opitutae bacterium]|nr:alpha,alpha-trehalase TreA [Opitutae bacterium]
MFSVGRRIQFGLLAMLVATLRVVALPPSPDVVYGELFADVQRTHVFADQKTFPDCVARRSAAEVNAAYAAERDRPGFDLARFVAQNFLVPAESRVATRPGAELRAHLDELWPKLTRPADAPRAESSLLPLPHAYVVPGGRFREVYYWDSYFTMLGLRESGREDLIESMVANFAHELATYGLIPNGNRSYYLTRSQPPFFALMVELLADKNGDAVLRRHRAALEAEHAYWMDERAPTRHVVRLADGTVLNRYWDRGTTPRPESFAIDEDAAPASARPAAEFFRDVRSAAESGWDFSSRWFADGKSPATIETTQVVPVDLNCLLYQLERTLAHARELSGDAAGAAELRALAERRKAAIATHCWSARDGFFVDLDARTGARREALTLAGVAPLFLGVATPEQAAAVARTLREHFLRPGGLVTTLARTGQQWDAPNGWAPLQWMAIAGLRRYGHDALAAEIARRWIALNRDVYARTGRMMEKYDVEDLSLAAGGGEYPTQDGFGWTNGVLLKLQALYPPR